MRLQLLKCVQQQKISFAKKNTTSQKTTTEWPDFGNECDCNAVLALAYAILLVQGKNPAKFNFRMSNGVHGTSYIHEKLFEMCLYDELMLFEEIDA